MIYFDNAASSFPKPKNVINDVSRFIRNNGANPGRSGHEPAMEAAGVVFDTRNEIAKMFGVKDVENVAFVPNATYGLNMLLHGLLKSGDHVITTELEHNSVLRPLEYLKIYKNIQYDIIEVDMYDNEKTIFNILSHIKSNTKLVACTHCSNVCGKVLPIKSIKEVIPAGISLLIDGSQSAGIIPTDISSSGIDYYCAPSHKGLLGLQGSGFIAVNSTTPLPVISGGTGSDSMSLLQPDYMPDAFESGTVSTPSILSMYSGIRFLNQIGINKIYEHKKMLVRYADEKLKKIKDVITYVDTKRDEFVGTICFNVCGKHSDEVASFLSKNGVCTRSGLHCAPFFHKKMHTESMGAVRISFSWFNSKTEIDEFIKILKKIY